MHERPRRPFWASVVAWLPLLPSWQVAAKWTVLVVAVLTVGGLLTAWSGIYSVAASRGHWPGFELFLKFGMRSSVRTHALGIEVPSFDQPDRLRRGAAHFEQGCAVCHGSPDRPSMAVVRSMLPEPSDLKVLVPTWKSNELFWIVRNGLKYTGMPAWPSLQRDDEVWDMVAFLRELPTLAPERYRDLAGIGHSGRAGKGVTEVQERLIDACTQCHGDDGRGRGSAFPRLDLQTEDYLLAQLVAYSQGKRASGFMQAATAQLTQQEMAALARHYAGPPAVTSRAGTGARSTPAAGERLFRQGSADQGLPACVTCHAPKAADRDRLYPALLGQTAFHTATQLRMFREGKRQDTQAARLMSTIAARLNEGQIDAVAEWLAGQPANHD